MERLECINAALKFLFDDELTIAAMAEIAVGAKLIMDMLEFETSIDWRAAINESSLGQSGVLSRAKLQPENLRNLMKNVQSSAAALKSEMKRLNQIHNITYHQKFKQEVRKRLMKSEAQIMYSMLSGCNKVALILPKYTSCANKNCSMI